MHLIAKIVHFLHLPFEQIFRAVGLGGRDHHGRGLRRGRKARDGGRRRLGVIVRWRSGGGRGRRRDGGRRGGNGGRACFAVQPSARGEQTLSFGPMKPVGLVDPRTGRWPYAAVQLRQENLRAGSYNLVGFQNHLRFGEQKRILRLIPGMENAEFLRFGQIHRNTYINAPELMNDTMQLKAHPNVFFAGQISGVEGYVESIATGLCAGRFAADWLTGAELRPFPRETAIGSLCHYISHADAKRYQPANIAFDLLPVPDPAPRDRRERQTMVTDRALRALQEYMAVYA